MTSRPACRAPKAAAGALLLVLLAACSGTEPRAATTSPTPRPTTTTATPTPTPTPPPPPPAPPPVWPLTGLPSQGLEVGRAVLVAKVDDTPAGRPQVGLGAADLVVSEPVEGGLTRLAVFFQSGDPGEVGPVRSVRTTDLGLVAPTAGALVASGGSGATLDELRGAGLQVVEEGGPGYARTRARRAPYNILVRLGETRAALGALPAPSVAYLPFAAAAPTPPGAVPAGAVETRWTSGRTNRWTFDPAAGWVRDGDAPEDRFAATTLLVLRVATVDTGQRDAAGNPVPEVVLVGDGEASVLAGASVAPARWAKGANTEALRLTAADGTPLALPPGRTWIVLLPTAGELTVG